MMYAGRCWRQILKRETVGKGTAGLLLLILEVLLDIRGLLAWAHELPERHEHCPASADCRPQVPADPQLT